MEWNGEKDCKVSFYAAAEVGVECAVLMRECACVQRPSGGWEKGTPSANRRVSEADETDAPFVSVL